VPTKLPVIKGLFNQLTTLVLNGGSTSGLALLASVFEIKSFTFDEGTTKSMLDIVEDKTCDGHHKLSLKQCMRQSTRVPDAFQGHVTCYAVMMARSWHTPNNKPPFGMTSTTSTPASTPSSQTAFNLIKAHQEILKLLQDKDPTLEIIPSKEGRAAFHDLIKFPANKTAYNTHFDHAIQKEPTKACIIFICHSVITNLKFSHLKFQNAKLMEHMSKNKIYIRYNQLDFLSVATLGFIQDIHPHITFCDSFTYI
jgi:hypothetical protein